MTEQTETSTANLQLLRYQIGRDIRNIRKERGFTQKQLSAVMGISRSTISKIENGKFAMSLNYLENLAKHLTFKINLTSY